ncbi:NADH:flavin oxidoreductase [Actinoalloteichus hymeniacidonis]|uniref:NADH:flavin oxidoreductase n=1 Tax=Actinoalloteichus hymeniacidonis TaxID=340345 RepID=A0AAC9MYP8_9PSEU|nr:NADH:flavin oxidoreductase [Actinoalloteichus hymeniacidonis]AOS64588.1 NADH:flavin oxidoreductase [Actinoalloteichus hymeniacidonis]MBB5907340.1 2,4-dienoyl-CoA reductase-like NADH-dependent reductase (Old Yellow Enzyme family) [Actinoalloteichus hymeniacidonis]
MTPSTSSATDAGLLDGIDPAVLFTPFQLGNLTLANRFVMAPMTRVHSPNGVPGEDVAAYYARRAEHLGLIVTEGTYIDHPSAGMLADVPRFYGEDALAGWSRVVEAVHAVGGRIIPQLWHIGVTRPEGSPPHPEAPVLSPSGIALDGSPAGVAATGKDLDDLIASFARAAKDAQRIGFDGIELHGAHGYLLDQFHWSVTNRRSDAYGGKAAARARLSAEIVAAIRAEVGPDFPIGFRFSQWKGGHYDARIAETPQELDELLTPLVEAGVSLWHVSARRYWLPGFEGSDRTTAGWTKHLTGLPTINIGSVGVRSPFNPYATTPEATASLNLAPLLELIDKGEFDLVALGRAVLSDPEWTAKLRAGRVGEIRGYEKGHENTLF